MTQTTTRPTRVIVVDGHPVFAEALANAIEATGQLTCVGTAADIVTATGLAEASRPDVAVLDAQLGGSEGLRLLLERHPRMRVLVLTGPPLDPALVQDVANSGAAGLLPKSTGLEIVVAAIPALGGHTFAVDRPSLLVLCESAGGPAVRRSNHPAPLTGREQDILSLLAVGVDLQAAAGRLGITVNTARGYVKNLYRKLGVHNQLELLAVAREQGLLDGRGEPRSPGPVTSGRSSHFPYSVADETTDRTRRTGWTAMLVRECLRTAPVTVPPGCTLEEAARLLGSHGVGSLLVVDGDRLVGIVTDRDITVRGLGEGKPASSPVEAVMTPDPVTIQGSADIYEAFTVFQAANSRRLPVLEDKDLAGIISVDDLLLSLVAEFGAVMSPVAQKLVHPA